MSQPHVTLDPDPLHVAELEADAWEAGYAAAIDDRRGRVAGLILAALSGAIVGALLTVAIVTAAPRSGSLPPIPAADAGQSGAPLDARVTPSWAAEAAAGTAVARSERRPDPAPAATDETRPAAPEPSSITGIASWYDAGAGLYAAVPSWRWGDEPYRVRVTAGGRAVVVTVGDFCGCPGGRVIDLSASAFRRLAPLSQGLVRVTVTRLGPGVTPPPTTTDGERP